MGAESLRIAPFVWNLVISSCGTNHFPSASLRIGLSLRYVPSGLLLPGNTAVPSSFRIAPGGSVSTATKLAMVRSVYEDTPPKILEIL